MSTSRSPTPSVVVTSFEAPPCSPSVLDTDVVSLSHKSRLSGPMAGS